MPSFTVEVAPSVLIWARKSAGITAEAAAKRLQVDIADVMAWEEGVEDSAFAKLTFARLRELAKLYRRPVTVFYLPTPPTDFLVPTDYRRVSGAGYEPPSTQLRFELRRLAVEREAAIELATLAQDMPASIEVTISLDDDIEDAGTRIRSWLNVSIGDQVRWDGSAFQLWTRSIEAKGILVAQLQKVPVEEARGCTIGDQPLPVLAVNQQDAFGGRLFTLIHELGHLLLAQGALCDLHENQVHENSKDDRVERFCNSVAASTLMPRLAILQDLAEHGSPVHGWDDAALRRIADRYGVSQEAALLRLVTLGLATRDEYELRRQLFLKLNRDARERRSRERREVRIQVARQRLAGYGRKFVADAISAFERREITASDLAGYLDMKIDHVPRIISLLRD